MPQSSIAILAELFSEFNQGTIHNILNDCENDSRLAQDCLSDLKARLKKRSRRKARARPEKSTPAAHNPSRAKRHKATHKLSYRDTNETCVTSHIATIARDMFIRKMVKITEAAEEAQNQHQQFDDKKQIGKEDTMAVSWPGEPIDKKDGRTYYDTALVDGELLKIGDTVYMRTDGEEPWFARIMSFFDDKSSDFQFHARFFSHGRETVLSELAGERELFLLDNCEDNDLHAVMGKANIVHVGRDTHEPTTFTRNDWWFYRFWYDPRDGVFEDATLHQGRTRCISCTENERARAQEEPAWINGALQYKGHEYHVHDFVYTLVGANGTPYKIAQIASIDSEQRTIRVRFLHRADASSTLDHYDMIKDTVQSYKDSRLLTVADTTQEIPVEQLEGKCWVEQRSRVTCIAQYKQNTSNFYTDSLIEQCQQCTSKRRQHEELDDAFEKSGVKLNALDIFAGCGGLTVGIEMSKVVQTTHAIEFNPDAATTFRYNYPGTTVHNQCANILLTRAISKHGNGEDPPLLDDFLGQPVADMPAPGEIDFIYCGPPCQGFSILNQSKKPGEIKNTLVCAAMSYVDFYRPSYFLLENVRGLISYKLGKEQIPNGVLKFILRCLTSMGYQVRFSVLQAAEYGVAQTRRRLFIWGARIGKRLPEFPQPTTCSPHFNNTTVCFADGRRFTHVKRSDERAPLPVLTIGDAVSDLPPFEYDTCESSHDNVPTFDGLRQPAGHHLQPYLIEPKTDFQAWFRQDSDVLRNHVARGFSKTKLERICKVDMSPNADHHSLPSHLVPWYLDRENPAAARYHFRRGAYGRLDYNNQFPTSLTTMEPSSKQGTIIHPNQRRVLSVREAARSQGFPDQFVFDAASDRPESRVKAMQMQIGNAVPVPLGASLGSGLRDALFKDWINDREE